MSGVWSGLKKDVVLLQVKKKRDLNLASIIKFGPLFNNWDKWGHVSVHCTEPHPITVLLVYFQPKLFIDYKLWSRPYRRFKVYDLKSEDGFFRPGRVGKITNSSESFKVGLACGNLVRHWPGTLKSWISSSCRKITCHT